jgi:Asp-tRNA(Asn)/Glu-tRNA(Gln) amidotransferase A subunit family amidase
MSALTSASATVLAGLIAARHATAREVVEAHLRRIEAVNRRSRRVSGSPVSDECRRHTTTCLTSAM